ncbi:MAG: AAA family ATPase [Chloroflexi bacterium]|nr:MAG: AAA family ATPase [Chloroflexota bacterium]
MENQPNSTSSSNQKESTPQGSSVNANLSNIPRTLLNKEWRARQIYELNTGITVWEDLWRRSGVTEREIELRFKEYFDKWKFEIFEKVPTGVTLSEVETKPIQWLWRRRIPLGKITLLDGDPGMGKSLLAITIAACASTGRPMPDGKLNWQGNIIFIAPEDGAEDTIKPRMEAAGGDPSRVFLLNTVLCIDEKNRSTYERPFSLSRDLKDLEMEINRTYAILVIIDPLTALLGRNIDSSRDQDVREVFTPLAQVAERTGCAILVIRHLSKRGSDNMLYRGAGSIGIIAAARTGLLVAQDPDDEQKRVFATIKSNLSKMAPNLSFQIVENERGVPYIQWLGENHHTNSTLLHPGTNLSFERQEILGALKDATGPLDTKEISELTGLKYASLRSILFRMQEAKEIVRLYRGKYTSPNHPSITLRSTLTRG